MLKHLFDNNRAWAKGMLEKDPAFFRRLLDQQRPEYLWIGCSDSRVPANQIVGMLPGELFVHRNVANVVVQTDLNCLSVIQYAVDVLGVRHVIVCGHYGCGGVLAALRQTRLGLIDNWLRSVSEIHERSRGLIDSLPGEAQRHDRLCELNVIEQVSHVCRTTVVQDAWRRRQELSIHGWIYGLKDGLVWDLGVSVSTPGELAVAYEASRARPSPALADRMNQP
jgi:carbonic anhydrase